jgi:hypothetical protein
MIVLEGLGSGYSGTMVRGAVWWRCGGHWLGLIRRDD